MGKTSVALNMGYQKFNRKRMVFLCISLLLLFFALFFSLCVGSANVNFSDACNSLLSPFGFSGGETADLIIWNSRLPRALVAIVAGAGLSLAGVVTQISMRNPLASPFTLGVSSSAAFGAALAITIGAGTVLTTYLGGFVIDDYYLVFLSSFAFALVATAIIFVLIKFRNARPASIVLAGIAIYFLFSAATSLVQYFGTTEQVAAIVFWLFGSLSKVTWTAFWALLLVCSVSFIVLYRWCWKFNALYMGDEVAKNLGVNADKLRLRCVTIASLITAMTVSFLGVISFICLVAPHISRMVVGGDHRYLIVASCLTGANILLIGDTLSRTLFLPLVLPVGIFTSFIGVPLFLYLLVWRKEYW